MTRDPLAIILRIRQATLDDAETAVAEAYRQEKAALGRTEAAVDLLDRETQTAMSITGSDDMVEAFARWLPLGQNQLRQAHDNQRLATASLDRARAVLTLARSGVKAVERMIEQRELERRQLAQRREQAVLDELGGRKALP